jgi:hydrogenase nickel incorporation protein HypA/HybF
MHEVDMTRCLVLAMEDWRAHHTPLQPSVERVHLDVGAFTCVEPDALRFTWGVAVRHTWLAGASLEIHTVPLVARCLSCGCTYPPEAERCYRSPCCDHPMEEIVSGRELRIRKVDYRLPNQERTAPHASTTASCAADQ